MYSAPLIIFKIIKNSLFSIYFNGKLLTTFIFHFYINSINISNRGIKHFKKIFLDTYFTLVCLREYLFRVNPIPTLYIIYDRSRFNDLRPVLRVTPVVLSHLFMNFVGWTVDAMFTQGRAIFIASTTSSTSSLATFSHSLTCTLSKDLYVTPILPHFTVFRGIYRCLFLITLRTLTLLCKFSFLFKFTSTAVTVHTSYKKFKLFTFYFLNFVVFLLFF